MSREENTKSSFLSILKSIGRGRNPLLPSSVESSPFLSALLKASRVPNHLRQYTFKMLSYNLFFLLLFLALTHALPSPVHVRDTVNKKPTPTRPFTIAAFESPFSANSNASGSHNVSGVALSAREGAFCSTFRIRHPPPWFGLMS